MKSLARLGTMKKVGKTWPSGPERTLFSRAESRVREETSRVLLFIHLLNLLNKNSGTARFAIKWGECASRSLTII